MTSERWVEAKEDMVQNLSWIMNHLEDVTMLEHGMLCIQEGNAGAAQTMAWQRIRVQENKLLYKVFQQTK